MKLYMVFGKKEGGLVIRGLFEKLEQAHTVYLESQDNTIATVFIEDSFLAPETTTEKHVVYVRGNATIH